MKFVAICLGLLLSGEALFASSSSIVITGSCMAKGLNAAVECANMDAKDSVVSLLVDQLGRVKDSVLTPTQLKNLAEYMAQGFEYADGGFIRKGAGVYKYVVVTKASKRTLKLAFDLWQVRELTNLSGDYSRTLEKLQSPVGIEVPN